jgi:hypothetical protein
MTMKITVPNPDYDPELENDDEIDVEVNCQFIPGYASTWDEPGCDDSIEINRGYEILDRLSDADYQIAYDQLLAEAKNEHKYGRFF